MIDRQTPIRTREKGQRMKRCERRDAKRIFLTSYAAHPVVIASCKEARISRAAFYVWLASDPLFNDKYQALNCAYYEGRYMYMSKEELQEYRRYRKRGEWLVRYFTGHDIQRKDRYATAGLNYAGLRS